MLAEKWSRFFCTAARAKVESGFDFKQLSILFLALDTLRLVFLEIAP